MYAIRSYYGVYKYNQGVIEQIEYLLSVHSLVPKLNVSYMRRAFMGRYEDDLRVTFDTNLKCSRHNDELNQKYMIHPSYAVMEIKADERVPMWLIRVIQKYNLEANRVSKYCLGVETLFDVITSYSIHYTKLYD